MPSEAAILTAAASPLTFADGATYLASPLSDRDIAELDEWVQARVVTLARASLTTDMTAAERSEVLQAAVKLASQMSWLTGRGSDVMAGNDGMARLCWQMVKRNHPGVTAEEIQAKFFTEANPRLALDREALIHAFSELNDVQAGEAGQASAASAPSKADVYRALARYYKFTPQQIADMTPRQQQALLAAQGESSREMTFATEAEFSRWLANRKP